MAVEPGGKPYADFDDARGQRPLALDSRLYGMQPDVSTQNLTGPMRLKIEGFEGSREQITAGMAGDRVETALSNVYVQVRRALARYAGTRVMKMSVE
jgi:hypothetical protein